MKTTLYDEDAAAEYVRLSARTLQKWRLEGRGPKFLKIGKRIMYREEDLEAFLASCLRDPGSRAR